MRFRLGGYLNSKGLSEANSANASKNTYPWY